MVAVTHWSPQEVEVGVEVSFDVGRESGQVGCRVLARSGKDFAFLQLKVQPDAWSGLMQDAKCFKHCQVVSRNYDVVKVAHYDVQATGSSEGCQAFQCGM